MVTVRSDARFCTPRCRAAWHRRQKKSEMLPAELISGTRWVRADGKRPIQIFGAPASSTNPETWSTFGAVRASSAGDGFGVMLGDGLGCYDFDKVSDAEARELAALISEPILFAERSLSGTGIHVFIEAPESVGSKKWQGRHERYTRQRFIRVTGNIFHL